jgi:hypothetical protein
MLLLEECGGSSLVRQTLYRTSTRQHSIRFPSPHGLPGMRAAKRPLPALSSQQQGQLLVRLWAANCPAETRLQPSANPRRLGVGRGRQHTAAPTHRRPARKRLPRVSQQQGQFSLLDACRLRSASGRTRRLPPAARRPPPAVRRPTHPLRVRCSGIRSLRWNLCEMACNNQEWIPGAVL